VLAHDRGHHTSYAETLRHYLDCRGDVGQAAKRAGAHPTPCATACGGSSSYASDLDDPDERLVTELQLRLVRHSPPPTG
jgi:hypothetical protein